ncbi:TetR/AcrR family transcriptional regulator [Lentzea sp.]|uniref:TetR/AcrR family transcriptional regulator n=1 Tax=Lentzea sp. TaxID=56099 RepID=UPI002D02CC97|nr:TetR family transcriptional regulator [Lentzea sp.]HUQ56379.1 TetR family transcriptional regulator [Lentzea sp.]
MEVMGLRERRRIQTREAIIGATLDLCAQRGFGATTVDAIAERADVSRRTFFRFFPTKENVLIALESDFFDAAVDVLSGSGRTGLVIELVGEALVEATTRFDDEWCARFVEAARVIDEIPAVEAVGLELCARTAGRLREVLRPREDRTPDHVVELALESAVSGWRLARRRWLRHDNPGFAELRELVREHVDALAAAAALVATATESRPAP